MYKIVECYHDADLNFVKIPYPTIFNNFKDCVHKQREMSTEEEDHNYFIYFSSDGEFYTLVVPFYNKVSNKMYY